MSTTDRWHRGGPYRARNGILLGVCKGIARHTGMPVFWVRLIALIMLPLTGFWPPVALYVIAAVIMKPEPAIPFRTEADEEFYNSFANSRLMALHRLKRTFDSLDRRIRRMESMVTDREYSWRQRLGE